MQALNLTEKTHSPLLLLKREDKDLLDVLAPETATRIRSCAGFLINYLNHWHKWKEANYPTRWVYQPLRAIQKDLMDIYTIHVLREAIALLVKLGLLSVRKNNRDENGRNGQDKSHQYWLHSDRIEALQKDLFPQLKSQSKSETLTITSETPRFNSKTSRFTVETHTHIPSIDSCKTNSLLEEQEELKPVQIEDPDPWTVEENDLEQEVLTPLFNVEEILQEQKDSGKGQFSAAPEPKCSEVAQTDLKPLPKLKSDNVSGFRSQEERDGFYQALLELGKTQGKKSPAAWSTKIVKSIDAGEPCYYLSEYREGQQVGSCEQQEWEVAPGQVFPRFISYLTTTLKKAGITDEQAIVTAHQQLKDVNLTRSLWESCKRAIANYKDNWEKQEQLGVSNAYLPPELLPKREVSVELLGSAIASLQAGSVQLQNLSAGRDLLQNLPESFVRSELEPAKEEPSAPEPEPPSPVELQEKLNFPLQAPLARMMARNAGYRIEEGLVLPAGEGMPTVEYLRSLLNTENRALIAKKIQRLIKGNPQFGFYFDEFGELWGF